MADAKSKLRLSIRITAVYAVGWLVGVVAWKMGAMPLALAWCLFSLSLPLGAAWLVWSCWPQRRDGVVVATVVSGVVLAWWHWSVFATDQLVLDTLRAYAARAGLAASFCIGLGWVVWWVDRAAQRIERQRWEQQEATDLLGWSGSSPEALTADRKIWNPLDPACWLYGRRAKKLNQSLTTLITYSLLFTIACLLFMQIGGCSEIYEMPAGGGQQQTIAQVLKVQKIIRKKFVVNKFSSILFQVPPIDEVRLNLNEVTHHAYQVGQGEGAGAGYAGGTQRGKVRFIRLEYSGGDWNKGMGIGGDDNMLREYGLRTKQKVAKQTESRPISALQRFERKKSPPLVYLTGQKNISLSKSEVKILREYLIDKHGMIFGDNGGSSHFHNQFVAMMRQVLPKVRPVAIPLDDPIHKIPFQIPFLPYVAPHGGKVALGWKVDGRWVCYYHPGDIGDAWSDDHAGVDREIWEFCYQLGTNVINYAHAEYSKWLMAQKEDGS